jgi:hypothetical protein
VIRWVHQVIAKEEIGSAPPGLLLERADLRRIWQPPDDPNAPRQPAQPFLSPEPLDGRRGQLGNDERHSLDEELTWDYAIFELDENWLSKFSCNCGDPHCRRTVTGRDWMRADLQLRYAGHFHPGLQKRIASYLTSRSVINAVN